MIWLSFCLVNDACFFPITVFELCFVFFVFNLLSIWLTIDSMFQVLIL